MLQLLRNRASRWLESKLPAYHKWAAARRQASQQRVEQQEIESIAATCELIELSPARPPCINISTHRITTLLNEMGAQRADEVIAAGRNSVDIRINGRASNLRKAVVPDKYSV